MPECEQMPVNHPNVDEYLRQAKQWQDEMAALREIALGGGLSEAWKWRAPCYTFGKSNVAIIGAFKEYCALSFFKGALLDDPKGILTKPGKNTQAGRLVRLTDLEQIKQLTPALKKLVAEAIRVEKAGLKVEFKKQSDPIPEELQNSFDDNPALQSAFEALTPGRQRAYSLHFSSAKQSKTRQARIEKCMPRIFAGKGLNDCVCGLSKRLPACDGSHKAPR